MRAVRAMRARRPRRGTVCLAVLSVGASLLASLAATPSGAATAADPSDLAPASFSTGVRTYVAVGDSITAGMVQATDSLSAPGATSWLNGETAARLQRVGGWAYPGTTTADMRAGFVRTPADVLVLLAGTNDLARGIPWEVTEANLVAIAAQAGNTQPAARGHPTQRREPAGAHGVQRPSRRPCRPRAMALRRPVDRRRGRRRLGAGHHGRGHPPHARDRSRGRTGDHRQGLAGRRHPNRTLNVAFGRHNRRKRARHVRDADRRRPGAPRGQGRGEDPGDAARWCGGHRPVGVRRHLPRAHRGAPGRRGRRARHRRG